jgi:K+-transporting ATPase ATPase C chain
MKIILISVKFLLIMTLLTGLIYPFMVFGIAKIFYPNKSAGSFVEVNGKTYCSILISRNFDSLSYFQPRPSAVNNFPMPSGASNYGPSSRKLKETSDSIKKAFIKTNLLPENTEVPPDAVFSSGSGIDPHISPENAFLQIDRISKFRNFDAEKKKRLKEVIYSNIEYPQFGILGEPVINVLKLNIELDKIR